MLNILKIKARLKEMGLTQKNLAQKMELNEATINAKLNDENGRTLTIDETNKILKILQIAKTDINDYFFTQKLESTQGEQVTQEYKEV